VNGVADEGAPKAEPNEANGIIVPTVDLTSENHPLLAHIRLYVFCSIYLIPNLQELAFSRITATCKDIGQPSTLDTQLGVIAGLRFAFRKLLFNDPLLDWLGQFAAYNSQQLRVQRDFHDLLQDCPNLGSRMVLSLKAAPSPPWESRPPKYNFGHYVPGSQYGSDDEED
jgi:hypothetical protein